MAASIKDLGNRESSMELDNSLTRKEKFAQGNGRTAKRQGGFNDNFRIL
jgi:hypothetical protein